MYRKTTLWLVVLLAAISFSMACGGQTDEANTLVNEGNAAFDKAKTSSSKANALINELVGDNLSKAEDFEKYKADNKAKFDEAISLADQGEKSMSEAAAKFDQASKMKLDDKFKEYLGLKGQEFKKRAETLKEMGTFVKAILAEKDAEKVSQLLESDNKKTEAMNKDAADLGEKAEKIVKDNPAIFKK